MPLQPTRFWRSWKMIVIHEKTRLRGNISGWACDDSFLIIFNGDIMKKFQHINQGALALGRPLWHDT